MTYTFDWKDVVHGQIEIEAESGRGLFLIHECFDDVRWSRKGNRLQLSLKK